MSSISFRKIMQVKLNTTFLLPFTLKICWLCTDICRFNFSHISNWTKNLILVYNDIGHLFILLNIYTWFIKQYDIGCGGGGGGFFPEWCNVYLFLEHLQCLSLYSCRTEVTWRIHVFDQPQCKSRFDYMFLCRLQQPN